MLSWHTPRSSRPRAGVPMRISSISMLRGRPSSAALASTSCDAELLGFRNPPKAHGPAVTEGAGARVGGGEVGLGSGVGASVGVALAVAVAVGVRVTVGVRVGVAVGDGVAVAVGSTTRLRTFAANTGSLSPAKYQMPPIPRTSASTAATAMLTHGGISRGSGAPPRLGIGRKGLASWCA